MSICVEDYTSEDRAVETPFFTVQSRKLTKIFTKITHVQHLGGKCKDMVLIVNKAPVT